MPGDRKDWAIVAALLIAVIGGGTAAKDLLFSGAAVTSQARAEAGVMVEINRQRAARGLPPLRLDAKLTNIARSWSMRMLLTGSFDHGDFEHRLYSAVGRRSLIAEDLGLTPSDTATGVVRQWMNSPPHKRNILLKDARRLGVGMAVGTWHGQPRTALITADFSS